MKKLFTLFAAVMMASGMWAEVFIEAPWTFQGYRTHNANFKDDCISYMGMNNSKWEGPIWAWQKEQGMGLSYNGWSEKAHQMGIFSYYVHSELIPS